MKSVASRFKRPLGPFAILYQPRATTDACKAPAKRGPKTNLSKVQQAARALETPEERTARITKRAKPSDVGRNFPSQADRTNMITGRRLGARFQ